MPSQVLPAQLDRAAVLGCGVRLKPLSAGRLLCRHNPRAVVATSSRSARPGEARAPRRAAHSKLCDIICRPGPVIAEWAARRSPRDSGSPLRFRGNNWRSWLRGLEITCRTGQRDSPQPPTDGPRWHPVAETQHTFSAANRCGHLRPAAAGRAASASRLSRPRLGGRSPGQCGDAHLNPELGYHAPSLAPV